MMSRKKSKPVTAKEMLQELHADPEWVTRQKAQEKRRTALADVLFASEAPLVLELRAAGFDVESAWDLFNRKEPWRKDVSIPPYPKAVPILIKYLGQPGHFSVREGIVRALAVPEGRVAFDRLVEEFNRTADPQVAAEEKRRAVELVTAGVGDLYACDEVERIMAARWESFRFALANAIGEHFQQEHIPLIVELLRDERHSLDCRRALADALRRKMRRWRRRDAEVLDLLESLRTP